MAGARAPAAPGSTEPDAVLHELQLFEEALSASVEAAGILNSLWKKPQQVKLLRRPPANPCSAKLAPLLLFKATHKAAQITEAVQAMLTCSDQVKAQGNASPAQSFLDCCLAKDTLSTLLQLLLWLQHRPEVLQLPALAAQHGTVSNGSAAEAAAATTSSSSSSSSSSIGDTSLRYGELWLAVTSALGAVLDCALTLKAADDANGEQEKTLLQLLQLLIQSGLQLQLPEFLGQAAKLLAASGQRLVCRPLAAAVRLMRCGIRDELSAALDLVTWSYRLLRTQMRLLWRLGQWQPQMQLLQHGGGQMLLQGLSLAVHCGSLDVLLRKEHLSVPELMETVQLFQPGSERDAMHMRRLLFTSQLARKHPVPFFQFADICASPGGSSQQHSSQQQQQQQL
ncbi:hypothetical protein OEZ85_004801 [Tetradesmus obliquus]|uniref:Uncharacterized protein n=1 Tax=Tetradesmus obliquus TaxID=3088 RepID=A0ABY8UFX0_TETOB|nr:hypothetical protein OEZ85_004801 [Tetradesmus obliquus]